MSVFNIALLSVLGFIFIYSLVDRICKCIEHKHLSDCHNEITTKVKNDLKRKCEDDINKYIL